MRRMFSRFHAAQCASLIVALPAAISFPLLLGKQKAKGVRFSVSIELILRPICPANNPAAGCRVQWQ
jgi:hypothetical protein